jgi:hypothetical protein
MYMVTRTAKKIMLILTVLFAFVSCSRFDCPLGAGSSATESRAIPIFTKIILSDKINLVLTQDSFQTVKVVAGKNLMRGIQTSVLDSVLTIQNNNTCNWLMNPDYQIDVYISSNLLQYISYYGSGNVSCTNTLRAAQFTFDSWIGTGPAELDLIADQTNVYIRNNNASVTISGQSANTMIYCAAAGSVDMKNFTSANMYIEQKSVRDIYVNVTNLLQAYIVFKGSLYYSGNPSIIDTVITSSGRLIHLP